MKKADRKNATKLRIKEKTKNLRITNTVNSSQGYKVVPIIDMGSSYDIFDYFSKNSDLNIERISACTYMVEVLRKKQKYLFVETKNLTDQEVSYICRYSDFGIVEIDYDLNCNSHYALVTRLCPNILVCCEKREYIKDVKKMAGDFKVLCLENLIEDIELGGISKITTRSFFIPERVSLGSDNRLNCQGYLRNGMVSKYFVVNGKYNLELEEIQTDSVFVPDVMFKGNDEVALSVVSSNTQEACREESSEDNECFEEISNEDLISDADDCENSNESLEEDLMINQKYSQYRKHDNAANSSNPPDNYNDLIFFKDYYRSLNSCMKHTERHLKSQSVILKFKPFDFTGISINLPVLVNLFGVENYNTIYNISFKAGERIESEELVNIDTGVRAFNACPLLVESGDKSVCVSQESMRSGFMSFIGPVVLDIQKLKIYKTSKGVNSEVEFVKFFANATFSSYINKPILDEVVLSGMPLKINKKYAVIRRMFNNKDDVNYYKKYDLLGPKGVTGIIKESVGTHGLFKAYFTRPIKHGDKIRLRLYKRVFLRSN